MKFKPRHAAGRTHRGKRPDSAAYLPYLKRIPFEELPLECTGGPKALARLLPYVRVLDIPRGRILVRPGQRPRGRLYLCSGQLSVLPARRSSKRQWESAATIVYAGSRHPTALTMFFPGCRQAQTLSPARVLYIEERVWTEFNTSSKVVPIPATHPPKLHEEPTVCVETWLEEFLDSPIMRRLTKSDWQQLLGCFETRTYPPGATIIRKYSRADCCYLIQSGHVIVHRDDEGQQVQARLTAADLFGTDALITGQRRNAWVTAADTVTVARLGAVHFRQHLLAGAERSAPQECTRIQQVCIDDHQQPGDIRINLSHLREQLQSLPRDTHYKVSGGSRQERKLCVFMMALLGLNAALAETRPAAVPGSIGARSDKH